MGSRGVVLPVLAIATAAAFSQEGANDAYPCLVDALPVPEPALREADVMWARRVWRDIDLRQKPNLGLYAMPRSGQSCPGLFDVILHGLLEERALAAYSPGAPMPDDAFAEPLTIPALMALLRPETSRTTMDPDTGDPIEVLQATTIDPGRIVRYRIKEDVIFDKQRSRMEVRIIGIAPMQEVHGDDGEFRGLRVLFWLYYPECRLLFARWRTPVRHNEAASPTFEEVFGKRLFTSTIVKASNVHDRWVTDHSSGVDALLESEAIRRSLLDMEFDLWHY